MHLPLRLHRPSLPTRPNPASGNVRPIAGPSNSTNKKPSVIECIEILSSDEDEPASVTSKGKGKASAPASKPPRTKSAFLTQGKDGIYRAVDRSKPRARPVSATEIINLVDSSEDELDTPHILQNPSRAANKPALRPEARPQSPYDASKRPHSSHKPPRPPLPQFKSDSSGVVRTAHRKHGGTGSIIPRIRPLPVPIPALPRVRRTVRSNVPHMSGARPNGVPIVIDLSLDSDDEDCVVVIPNAQPPPPIVKAPLARAPTPPLQDTVVPSGPPLSSSSTSSSASSSSAASSSSSTPPLPFDARDQSLSPATSPPDSVAPDTPRLHSPSPDDTPILSLEKRIAFESVIRQTEPEAPPITLDNTIDDELVPPDAGHYQYSNDVIFGAGVPSYAASIDHTKLQGCNCAREGTSCSNNWRCKCMRRQRKAVEMYGDDHDFRIYNPDGRLRRPTIQLLINECNLYCGCGIECLNRVVQKGRKVPLKLAKTKDRGWGVFASSEGIPAGTFIGNYAGEMLTDEVLDKRNMINNSLGSSFALDIDYYWIKNQETYSIDASLRGNFTRYLNHSCEPSCGIHGVYINEGIRNKATHCIFTSRDILPGEELTISYLSLDDDDVQQEPETAAEAELNAARQLVCKCGSQKCVGRIFNL